MAVRVPMAETIYALSSGLGRAGVAVVRVSGPAALSLPQLFAGVDVEARKARLAGLRHPTTGELIDRGLMLLFPAPNSFTGEDVVEFHVHGGRAVVTAMIDALSSCNDLRAAEPGEFTRRAFANGKLDLASAEGLADLIAADTELQRQRALRQMSGVVGERCRSWRSALVDALALVEAYLDFPDEEEIPQDVSVELKQSLSELLDSFDEALGERGNAEIVRDGAVVLISGPPNAGKSTLINKIARRDVAIISDTAGTTRDLLEVTVDLRGIPVTFVDSAGIHEARDPVEAIGVARARERAAAAHLVLWLSPVDEPMLEPGLQAPNLTLVNTKLDKGCAPAPGVAISAFTGDGLDDLLDFVYQFVQQRSGTNESPLLSSRRQFECLAGAAEAVRAALVEISAGRLELAAEEVRVACRRLGELTGAIGVEDVLDEVFGRFCLGK